MLLWDGAKRKHALIKEEISTQTLSDWKKSTKVCSFFFYNLYLLFSPSFMIPHKTCLRWLSHHLKHCQFFHGCMLYLLAPLLHFSPTPLYFPLTPFRFPLSHFPFFFNIHLRQSDTTLHGKQRNLSFGYWACVIKDDQEINT